MKKYPALVVPLFLMLAATQLHAETTSRDLQVTARALSFLETPLSGTINFGIVYDAANARSRGDAEQVRGLLGEGMRIGNVVLKPVLVPVTDVSDAGVDILFLTESLHGFAYLPAQMPLCITTDLKQVTEGNCVVGIQSQPRIEIIVNKKLGDANGVRFSSVFRMMVKEV